MCIRDRTSAASASFFADSSLTALIRYHVRLSAFTLNAPVLNCVTVFGKTCCISCAITPSWDPSWLTTTASGFSKSVISSTVLYSKLRTCICFILSSPVSLLVTFFLILISEVVVQVDVLPPW